MILEVLDGPDIWDHQDVIATVEPDGDGFKVTGPRAEEFAQSPLFYQRALAARTGQFDRETLKLTGKLPSPDETLRFWLDQFPERTREAAPKN